MHEAGKKGAKSKVASGRRCRFPLPRKALRPKSPYTTILTHQHGPLCDSLRSPQTHNGLKKDHKLKHDARRQYGLFLKVSAPRPPPPSPVPFAVTILSACSHPVQLAPAVWPNGQGASFRRWRLGVQVPPRSLWHVSTVVCAHSERRKLLFFSPLPVPSPLSF